MPVELFNYHGDRWTYWIGEKNKQVVVLEINSDKSEIALSLARERDQFGKFVFEESTGQAYRLLSMSIGPYLRHGLGREALKLFRAATNGAPVYIHPDDNPQLSTDARAFVERMKTEKLMVEYQELDFEPIFFGGM